ncbi:hypothetical protein [Desertivirga brevis]|uniref:hypothetical protein n=1 Tax=Desertivirga brevis TaxID=2810310 RepID=UPI001A970068|nr:hypothetical protein [Pedobacter sp. SYSU D00873]
MLKLCPYIILLPVLLLANAPHTLAVQENPSQTERIDERLAFIGEVKGRSYIKIDIRPIKKSGEFAAENESFLRYQGTYFESVTGNKYTVTADFSAEDRVWTFRCFDTNNCLVYVLKGKQKQDGDIDGTCKAKLKSYSFYLRPQ